MMPSAGHSGDMGWGDGDTDEVGPVWATAASVSLMIATGLYWGSLWLIGGFPPLAQLVTWRRDAAPADDSADFAL
jgi:hypothetical protein